VLKLIDQITTCVVKFKGSIPVTSTEINSDIMASKVWMVNINHPDGSQKQKSNEHRNGDIVTEIALWGDSTFRRYLTNSKLLVYRKEKVS